MKALLLLLALALSGLARADGAATGTSLTVKAGFLSVKVADLTLKNKEGYVYLLWDAFPYAAALAAEAASRHADLVDLRHGVAEDLAQAAVAARFPKAAHFKMDVVEIPERDQYGAPHWPSLRKLEHDEGDLGSKKSLSATAKD